MTICFVFNKREKCSLNYFGRYLRYYTKQREIERKGERENRRGEERRREEKEGELPRRQKR
jgi:hypothetical protein